MIQRRERIRRHLNPLFTPFFDALCAKLGEEWQPYSGMRTFIAQDGLYAQGRTAPGEIVTNAKGGESGHNYGAACDWCIWSLDGEPSWPNKGDPCWLEFKKAVEESGLRWGGDWGDFDHCEIRIDVPWTTIRTIFFDRGPEAANGAIRASMSGPIGDES